MRYNRTPSRGASLQIPFEYAPVGPAKERLSWQTTTGGR